MLRSLYDDIQKIVYVQYRSASKVRSVMMEKYRMVYEIEFSEYETIKDSKYNQ